MRLPASRGSSGELPGLGLRRQNQGCARAARTHAPGRGEPGRAVHSPLRRGTPDAPGTTPRWGRVSSALDPALAGSPCGRSHRKLSPSPRPLPGVGPRRPGSEPAPSPAHSAQAPPTPTRPTPVPVPTPCQLSSLRVYSCFLFSCFVLRFISYFIS